MKLKQLMGSLFCMLSVVMMQAADTVKKYSFTVVHPQLGIAYYEVPSNRIEEFRTELDSMVLRGNNRLPFKVTLAEGAYPYLASGYITNNDLSQLADYIDDSDVKDDFGLDQN